MIDLQLHFLEKDVVIWESELVLIFCTGPYILATTLENKYFCYPINSLIYTIFHISFLSNVSDHITFSPPLPGDKQELYKRMPMAAIIKVIVTYEEVSWTFTYLYYKQFIQKVHT